MLLYKIGQVISIRQKGKFDEGGIIITQMIEIIF